VCSKLGLTNDDERWFPDKLPFWGVLAAYPTQPREKQSLVVNLNMVRCREGMDSLVPIRYGAGAAWFRDVSEC
jgi:hypothetical protein